jgi:hypothetical protein
MTKTRRSPLRTLAVYSLWALGGLLLVVAVALTWWSISLSNARDQAQENAKRYADESQAGARQALRDGLADGDLTDLEITDIRRVGGVVVLDRQRSADRITVTVDIESVSAGSFSGAAVSRCIVYEIDLPFNPETVVEQREMDSCPPAS